MLALPGALVTEQPAALSTRLAAQSLRRIAPRTTAQDPGARGVLDRLRILPLLNVLPTHGSLWRFRPDRIHLRWVTHCLRCPEFSRKRKPDGLPPPCCTERSCENPRLAGNSP